MPRRQRRTQLPPQQAPATYAAVAATMSLSTRDQPSASTQGESTPGLDRKMESNGNIMDPVPTHPERCNSPMDSTPGTEMGDPQAPQPPCNRTFEGSSDPSLLEVTDPPRETNEACQQKTGTEDGPLPGKEDNTQSRQNQCNTLPSNQPSLREDDTMDDVEASTPQHDSLKPEDPMANPKRPKKMRYDKSPLPPQERTRSMSRRVAHKDGKVRCPLPCHTQFFSFIENKA